MEHGYALKYMGRGEWDDVVVGDEETRNAKFEGFGTIYGSRMAVWKVGLRSYAQTAVGDRHESHWIGEAHGDLGLQARGPAKSGVRRPRGASRRASRHSRH